MENQSFAAVSFERGILWNALADLRTCYVFGLIFQNAWRAVDEKWDKLPDAEDSWREENDNFSTKNFFCRDIWMNSICSDDIYITYF